MIIYFVDVYRCNIYVLYSHKTEYNNVSYFIIYLCIILEYMPSDAK